LDSLAKAATPTTPLTTGEHSYRLGTDNCSHEILTSSFQDYEDIDQCYLSFKFTASRFDCWPHLVYVSVPPSRHLTVDRECLGD